MNITIDSTQIQVLENFFKELSNSDQKKIFTQAYRKASKPIVDTAKALVPVETGNLRRSIGTINLSDEIAILVGAKKSNKGWHGHLIENGTVNRYRKSKTGTGFTGRVTGIHFMESAFNTSQEQVYDSIEQEWLKAIDKYITKINK